MLGSVSARFFALLLGAVLLAGCADPMEPARKAIADIEAAVTAAGTDAAQYVPDQVEAVQGQVADLKAKFEQKDYKAVIAAAPALLAQANELAGAAAEAKQAAAVALEAFKAEWGPLATEIPAQLEAVTARVETLAKSKQLPAGLDATKFESVKASVEEAKSQWSQAVIAQAEGNVDQAVTAARKVREKLDAAMTAMGTSAG